MKDVDIFDISYEGSGVGKIDGKIVFVPKTLPDEKIKAEVIKQTNSFSVAKVVEIEKSSEHRTQPLCPYFFECGGCDFQHCDEEYEKQLKIKILKNELKKVGYNGKIDFVSSDKRYYYRNKIKLEFKDEKLGYFKSKSHEIFEVEQCPIASEKINKAIKIVKEFLKKNKFDFLKNVYFKEVDDCVAICFLFDKKCKKSIKNAENFEIFDDFSVFFAFGDILEDDKTQIFCVKGNENLTKIFMNEKMKMDISSFNQVNDFVAEKLYQFISKISKNKRVINAYSGQGFLTKLLSKNCKFVYGIEYQKSAHEIAENFANENNIKNLNGKVEDILPTIVRADFIDFIVLDPSREGCKNQVLEAIDSGKIENVCYVSCNFASLCRDLKFLIKNYKISEVKIFDMFPLTANLETVVVLKRK